MSALASSKRSQPGKDPCRGWWTATDRQVNRDDNSGSAQNRVTSFEHPAIHSAVAHRNNPFRVRRGVPGLLQGCSQIAGQRTGHQQHIRMARAVHESQAKTLQIIENAA